MSVWHETQIEHTVDAVDSIIDDYGTSAELDAIREIVVKAWKVVTDLPENVEQSLELLADSNNLLSGAGLLVEKEKQQVPNHQERAWRILRNRIKNSQTALIEESALLRK